MRNDLSSSDREELERILSHDPSMLTPDEMAHLKARRDYLTKAEQATFASVLEEPKGKEPKEEPKKAK